MSVASEIARLQNAKASIKTAIENKGVTVGDIKLDAYSAKIDEISAGVEPTGTLEITENGTYDVKQKAYAKVAVPEPSGNIKITENGFHIIKQYSIAEVAVYPTLVAKTIIANGTYNASDDNAYGYGSVSVNVPEKNLGTKTINANGDYNATDDSLDGYSNVSVSVPEKTLTTKTITANGTYNATHDNADGYSQVTVATSGVDINDYFTTTLSTDGQMNKTHWQAYFKKVPPVTISGTSAEYLFYCYPLPEHPSILTSNQITNIHGLFYYANITKVKPFDTSKCTTADSLFGYCYFLQKIPRLNFENITRITSMCDSCRSLEIVGGFENLGKAYDPTHDANALFYGLDLSYSKKLTHESLMNVINNLYDIASKGVATQKLIIGNDNKAKLTAEEIAIATNKGWNVS